MNYLLHPHPLLDGKALNVSPHNWVCDKCKKKDDAQRYRCHQCDYDLCKGCWVNRHPHSFTLQYSQRDWMCDLCRKEGKKVGETSSYVCSGGCDFDVCEKCYIEKHPHAMSSTLVHEWCCDVCSIKYANTRSMRCKYGCDYDVCHNCWKNMQHPHLPLQINHSNRTAKCISCNIQIYGRYHHCKIGCEYEICDNCYKTQSQRGANANPLARSLPVGAGVAQYQPNPLSVSVIQLPVQHIHVPVQQNLQPPSNPFPLPVINPILPVEVDNPPVQPQPVINPAQPLPNPVPQPVVNPVQPVVVDNPPVQPDPTPSNPKVPEETTDDETSCVICFEEPRNAVYVPCGHVCCCLVCANDYFNTKKSCPMCRQTVIMVVKCHFS